MTDPKPKAFEQWCLVEIMGHQSVVGRCSEEQIAGATLLRVDVPDGEAFTTQYVGGGSIYRIRVVSEEVGRTSRRNASKSSTIRRPRRQQERGLHDDVYQPRG